MNRWVFVSLEWGKKPSKLKQEGYKDYVLNPLRVEGGRQRKGWRGRRKKRKKKEQQRTTRPFKNPNTMDSRIHHNNNNKQTTGSLVGVLIRTFLNFLTILWSESAKSLFLYDVQITITSIQTGQTKPLSSWRTEHLRECAWKYMYESWYHNDH